MAYSEMSVNEELNGLFRKVSGVDPWCGFASLTGYQSAEGSGHGEDHDCPGQESEWRPKEETLCGHRHSRRSQGTWSFYH